MSNVLNNSARRVLVVSAALFGWRLYQQAAAANPTGGSVAQGSATINNSGSQETVTTAGNAYINWQSFNIAAGETTTFVEPTSSSVVWNNINGSSPSQILGNLNANGYVVLQNQAGFYIGGQAAVSAHGLVLTTASAAPNLSSGGAWQFDAPPPTAKIINYGQINIAGGGSAFLIADDIENNGTISAPLGNIGLYAGETVLVSTSPDGRGLSAQVTLPQGSVDNHGQLIADGGSIAAQAQTVNQNGLVQANSVQNVNGTIELVASDAVKLGANSAILAQGDITGISSGGSVTIKSGGSFSDQAGSTVNISGGAQGGNGGQAEISAPQMESLQTSINGHANSGFVGGVLTIDPANLWLATANTDSADTQGYPIINVTSAFTGLSQINLQADNNIVLDAPWTLSASLTLTAGNDITLNNGAYIAVASGNNYSVSLSAGPQNLTSAPGASLDVDEITLNGSAYIHTQNGNINLWAANGVDVNSGEIATLAAGNIDVTGEYGNVNTGDNFNGYVFAPTASLRNNAPPYYTVSPSLGGISTAAGGNVSITAGGNVTSYLPNQTDYTDSTSRSDAGAGAFGTEPGNVTITAGGSVSGNYVVANGVGTVTAGGNIGVPLASSDQNLGFAISLVDGSWSVYAPKGSIYLDDVINPNGVFNDNSRFGYTGFHNFDYGPDDSVLLDAGDSVEITGAEVPLAVASQNESVEPGTTVPVLFPSSLTVIAGSGGFVLDTQVILFPSPDQNLDITTLDGGNFVGIGNASTPSSLEMSDSSATQWVAGTGSFGPGDQGATPLELNNPNPVNINISGSIENLNLYTTKETEITVGGNADDFGFSGENLHAGDITSITVGGSIFDSPLYSFVQLSSGIASASPLQSSALDSVFTLALNPAQLSQLESLNFNSPTIQQAVVNDGGLDAYLVDNGYVLFASGTSSGGAELGANPGFVYDPGSDELGFKGNMVSAGVTTAQLSALESGKLTVLVVNSTQVPIINANGQIETTGYTFSAAPEIGELYTESETTSSSANGASTPLGYEIGGPGQFNISAQSIDLGNSWGILSFGFGDATGYNGVNYAALEGVSGTLGSGGAAVNVDVAGNLSMATSAIASLDGGNVTVNAGGEIDLSEGDFVFQTTTCYGIYTSGHSDVEVTAEGTINVGSARIAAFNGGNVFVESYNGDVNAGIGADLALDVNGFLINPKTGLASFGEFGDLTDASTLQADPTPYGSGIMALLPNPQDLTPGGNAVPGNITVITPNGNINSTLGGISQFALASTTGGGATINLTAGTPGIPGTPSQGNIDVGGGIIGETVNVTAQGNITGEIISKQNSNIQAGQNFSGIVVSGGTPTLSAGGLITGTIVGVSGINASGGQGVTASLLSENVSGSAGAKSALASSATGTSTSQSAAQQASSQANQQVAADSSDQGDDTDDRKKENKPALLQHIKRVTVILPKAT
jgi:filamentous hemagglutinin family protein